MIPSIHAIADLHHFKKGDATTPSYEDICARVLASHVIREKNGTFTAVVAILLELKHCGRRCHPQKAGNGFRHRVRN